MILNIEKQIGIHDGRSYFLVGCDYVLARYLGYFTALIVDHWALRIKAI